MDREFKAPIDFTVFKPDDSIGAVLCGFDSWISKFNNLKLWYGGAWNGADANGRRLPKACKGHDLPP